MTFRPSDDVLDEIASWQVTSFSADEYWTQSDWQHMFTVENEESSQNVQGAWIDFWNIDIPDEEIKAPDLSELLKDSWNDTVKNEEETSASFNKNSPENFDKMNTDLSEESKISSQSVVEINQSKNLENGAKNIDIPNQHEVEDKIGVQEDYPSSGKMLDDERVQLVSSFEGSINSNLDFLVDKNWVNVVEKYRKIHRLFFRWGLFLLSVIVGISWWILLQVKASVPSNLAMMNDSSIQHMDRWIEDTSDKKMQILVDSGVDVNILVPYWSVSIDWKSFSSKSNLINYNWVILPQLSSVSFITWEFISLKNVDVKDLTRNDVENLVDDLIINNSNYRNTTNLSNVWDIKRSPNILQWWLYDGFNLNCLDNDKVSDIVCDKFLDVFYTYGKYYNLSEYSSELSKLVRDMKKHWKEIDPICSMIKDYTLRSGLTSDILTSIMESCGANDYQYYKKLINFIDLENSLWQPELSDRVFDDPDLNAYKLLSAQQSVYKILDGTSLNENYIKSYLNYVQFLLNKDNGSNRYLQPIYKDLLYVFNMDELYQKLMKSWKLSSALKQQIEQINNWNVVYGYSSLLSQLTVHDIVKVESDFTWLVVEERTIEDIFSQYYAMTDRLKIRKASFISDKEIKVQTEIYTDKILSVTDGETLKVTVVLRRQDNLLYVDSIKVANQRKFSDILWIYASEWDVTFYAMLNYIDEQVWMRYELIPEDLEEQPTFCEEIMKRKDISVYGCDDSSISLYKWEVEYNFVLDNGVLDSFTISDENLDQIIKSKLDWVMFMRDDTPTIVTSIIDFTVESADDNIDKKLEIINQFRIHFKLVPDNIYDIEWESDVFLVNFTLWEFKLQAYYDMTTHLLTKISYANCEKPLEIRQLSLEITSENESQLIEILNNPRVFFASVNPSIYKKYQKVCWGKVVDKK